jgi:hypothetical protein
VLSGWFRDPLADWVCDKLLIAKLSTEMPSPIPDARRSFAIGQNEVEVAVVGAGGSVKADRKAPRWLSTREPVAILVPLTPIRNVPDQHISAAPQTRAAG